MLCKFLPVVCEYICDAAVYASTDAERLECSAQRWVGVDTDQSSRLSWSQGWEAVAVKCVPAGRDAQQELEALMTLQAHLNNKRQAALQAGTQVPRSHVIPLLDTFTVTKDVGTSSQQDYVYLITRSSAAHIFALCMPALSACMLAWTGLPVIVCCRVQAAQQHVAEEVCVVLHTHRPSCLVLIVKHDLYIHRPLPEACLYGGMLTHALQACNRLLLLCQNSAQKH